MLSAGGSAASFSVSSRRLNSEFINSFAIGAVTRQIKGSTFGCPGSPIKRVQPRQTNVIDRGKFIQHRI